MGKVKPNLKKTDKENNIIRDEEYKATNRNFVQIYKNSQLRLAQLCIQSPLAAAIFIYLTKISKWNNTAFIKVNQLAETFHKSRRQIYREINLLREKNFIAKIKWENRCVYLINPRIAFSSNANNKTKIQEYYDKLTEDEPISDTDRKLLIDKTIIDSDIYDEADQISFAMKFYKLHEKVQPITVQEVIDYCEEKPLDMTGTPFDIEAPVEQGKHKQDKSA